MPKKQAKFKSWILADIERHIYTPAKQATQEEISRETQWVAKALAANSYPANFIYNGRQLNRQQETNETDQCGLIIVPNAKGFSEKVAHVLREVSTYTSRSPVPSRTYFKKKLKDNIEKEASREIVHKITC